MKALFNRLIGDDRGGAIAEFMLGLIPLVIAFALISTSTAPSFPRSFVRRCVRPSDARERDRPRSLVGVLG